MKIVLATGVYPPDLGGPATYTKALAKELLERGYEVIVISYGNPKSEIRNPKLGVIRVSKSGGPFLRWWRYSRALKKYGADADIVYCFSSVSTGVPLRMSGVTKPKRVLRLGGDFLWERYTDRGGRLSLWHWYEAATELKLWVMNLLLSHFDHLVFSTAFQQEIYEKHYQKLPEHSVIENAVPSGIPSVHQLHTPFRLLFMGRFVKFKNISLLLDVVAEDKGVTLSIVGDGPEKARLMRKAEELKLGDRVVFIAPQHGEEKKAMFDSHDLFVVPSITDISPNAALEAAAHGLPVLLTSWTGLSEELKRGMIVLGVHNQLRLFHAIGHVRDSYAEYAAASGQSSVRRSWFDVTDDTVSLFSSLS